MWSGFLVPQVVNPCRVDAGCAISGLLVFYRLAQDRADGVTKIRFWLSVLILFTRNFKLVLPRGLCGQISCAGETI
jgi:hypothetical protein